MFVTGQTKGGINQGTKIFAVFLKGANNSGANCSCLLNLCVCVCEREHHSAALCVCPSRRGFERADSEYTDKLQHYTSGHSECFYLNPINTPSHTLPGP